MHANVHRGRWISAVAEATRLALVRRHADLPRIARAARLSPEALERRLDASVPFDVSELEWIAAVLDIDVQDIFDSAALIQAAPTSKRRSLPVKDRRTGDAAPVQRRAGVSAPKNGRRE
ncbi:hypothetical protein H490_0103310 [Leucobacter sp. UCD-THU]|nr:hypothetical protein H490_0103310 [Leucobacter sp. UCD-THU]